MKQNTLLLMLLVALLLFSVAGCAKIGYGYRTQFGGGPHIDNVPEITMPLFMVHRPVPYEELRNIFPPENNISGL